MAGRALLLPHNGLFMAPSLSSIASSRARHLGATLRLPPRSFSPASISSYGFCRSEIRGEEQAMKPTKSEAFVLTTPLYYVNAPPHMGSAYTTIAADAVARFQRLLGKNVIFVTGTDEHGEKIAAAAASSGRTPIEHCEDISSAYRSLWKELDISHDKFIRTTDPNHEAIVKEFYARVLGSGDIYRADYEGLYCVGCEEYKDEKELLENNVCPIHLKPCTRRTEDNYFFALSKYQKSLEEYLVVSSNFVQPSFRLNEVQSWIKSGLRDFSISRASVEWGIPVPEDNRQTIYVWFDALLGPQTTTMMQGEKGERRLSPVREEESMGQ